MSFLDGLAERLGVSRWVIWVGLAALVVAIIIIVRRLRGQSGAASPSTADVLNGPFAGGIDGTTANPVPPSPDGGADTGTTPAPTQPAPTSPPPAKSAAVYVHPTAWPTKTSTLSGIASAYGVSLASIEAFPENQYIKQRSPRGFDLIYTSDTIRVR